MTAMCLDVFATVLVTHETCMTHMAINGLMD